MKRLLQRTALAMLIMAIATSMAQAATPHAAKNAASNAAAISISDVPFAPVMPPMPGGSTLQNVYDANDSFDAGTTRALLALAGAFALVGALILEERLLARLFPSFWRPAAMYGVRSSDAYTKEYIRAGWRLVSE